MKEKSITYLRFAAAMIIFNSHLDLVYPPSLRILATGGLWGNCLFILISGYCMTNACGSFLKWMKKRVLKIYPAYLIHTIPVFLSLGAWPLKSWLDLLLPISRYHFIASILCLYPIYYGLLQIKNKFHLRIETCISFFAIIQLTLFIFSVDVESYTLRDHFSLFEMSSYMVMMCIGVSLKGKNQFKNVYVYIIGLTVSIGAYFVVSKYLFIGYFKILTWYVSYFFCYSLFSCVKQIEYLLPNNKCVNVVSEITLEVYIVQMYIINVASKIEGLPKSLCLFTIYSFGGAIVLHYFANCVQNIILRIFTKEYKGKIN